MGASIKLDKAVFSKEIEDLVLEKDIRYIDAVLMVCEHHEVEPDTVAKLISQPIRERLEIEGREINILPKKNQLPL